MCTLQLDKDNNLVIEGDILIHSGNKALSQDIKTYILLQIKEYIYDTTIGVDWVDFFQTHSVVKLLSEIEAQIYKDSRVKFCEISTTKETNGNLVVTIETTFGESISIDVE